MKYLLRERLDSDRPTCGAFTTLADPAILEIVGLAGYDFAMIDLEHTGLGLDALENSLRAAKAYSLGVLVRVPSVEPKFILRLLDLGVEGILVPHVASVEEAQSAVQAVRYPPVGRRGFFGAARAADYGGHGLGTNRDLAQSMDRLVVLALMLEDREGIADCEAITAVPGVDIAFVGPADLSTSLGVNDTVKHPEIGKAIERVSAACRTAGVRLALPVEHGTYPLTAAEAYQLGARVLLAGMDRTMLMQGYKATCARLRETPVPAETH